MAVLLRLTSSLLSFLCFFAISAGVAHGNLALRLSFRYAFEDEGMLATDREPTRKEVEAVLCQSNLFFSKSLQIELENPALIAVAKEGDWVFEDYVHTTYDEDGNVLTEVPMPANIIFTLAISTADNRTIPSLNEVQTALPKLDLHSYLKDYVMRAAPNTVNFFYEARGINWESAIVQEVKGNITSPKCPKDAQPEGLASIETGEGMPPTKKENYTGSDNSNSNGFSLKLGFWDDTGREPLGHEWEALICEVDSFTNKELQRGLGANISSHSTNIRWGFDTEQYLPAQVNFSLAAIFPNGTVVPPTAIFEVLTLTNGAAASFTSKYINKAFPEGFSVFAHVDKLVFRGVTLDAPDPATTLAKATCPVMMHTADQAHFEIKVRWGQDTKREPTRNEVEAMMCETDKFFRKRLRDELNDPSIVSYATNIDWNYNPTDEYQIMITFTSTTLNGDGSYVRGAKVMDIMKEADTQFFTEFYVLNALPYESNIFFFTKNLYFGGGLGKQVTSSKIPKGVKCKNHDDSRHASFTVEVGFDNRTGIPTKQDVEGLMCQTNLFLEKRLKTVLKDDTIHSHATNVDWEYDAGADLPAIVRFTAFSTYGDGTAISARQVYDTMKVIDVPDYVRNYVWNSEPYNENIYYDTKDIMFGGVIGSPVREGKLARVMCAAPVLTSAIGTALAAKSTSSLVGDQTATKKIDKSENEHYGQLPAHRK